jgi:Uma2 family endonuclease
LQGGLAEARMPLRLRSAPELMFATAEFCLTLTRLSDTSGLWALKFGYFYIDNGLAFWYNLSVYLEVMMATARASSIFDDELEEILGAAYLDGVPCHERIGDVIYIKMSIASEDHQDIITEFVYQIKTYFKENKSNCTVKSNDSGWDLSSYFSELREMDKLEFFLKKKEIEWKEKNWEVRKHKEFPFYLVPDVMILCNRFREDWGPNGFKGVPSLIIEVLSPSTFGSDMGWKKDIYEAMKVQEYWVIDIINTFQVIRYNLIDGKYVSEEFLFKNVLQFPSQLFSGLILDISDITLPFLTYLDRFKDI